MHTHMRAELLQCTRIADQAQTSTFLSIPGAKRHTHTQRRTRVKILAYLHKAVLQHTPVVQHVLVEVAHLLPWLQVLSGHPIDTLPIWGAWAAVERLVVRTVLAMVGKIYHRKHKIALFRTTTKVARRQLHSSANSQRTPQKLRSVCCFEQQCLLQIRL